MKATGHIDPEYLERTLAHDWLSKHLRKRFIADVGIVAGIIVHAGVAKPGQRR